MESGSGLPLYSSQPETGVTDGVLMNHTIDDKGGKLTGSAVLCMLLKAP